MPLPRAAAAVKKMNEDGLREQAQQGIPAERLKNQLPPKVLPPATSSTRGGVTLSDATPAADGTGAAGSSSSASRADHVHPAGGGSSLTVQEVDGSPSDSAVTKIIFPNGTLSIVSHEATYTPTGGGGSDSVTTGTAAAIIPGLAGSADIAGTGAIAEEYDTSTPGLTWTPGAPAAVDSNTTIKSHLYLRPTDATERFGTRAWAPGSGAFDARAKLALGLEDPSAIADVSLLVGDSGLSNFALVQLQAYTTTPTYRVTAYSYNGSYTQRGAVWNLGTTAIYARITRDGSGNVSWWWSADGLAWQLIATAAFSVTVAKLGYRLIANSAVPYVIVSDWLRTD